MINVHENQTNTLARDFNLIRNRFNLDSDLIDQLEKFLNLEEDISLNFFILKNFLEFLETTLTNSEDELASAAFRIYDSLNELLYTTNVTLLKSAHPQFPFSDDPELDDWMSNPADHPSIRPDAPTDPVPMIQAFDPVEENKPDECFSGVAPSSDELYLEPELLLSDEDQKLYEEVAQIVLEVSPSSNLVADLVADDVLDSSINDGLDVVEVGELLLPGYESREFVDSDDFKFLVKMFRSCLDLPRTRISFYSDIFIVLMKELILNNVTRIDLHHLLRLTCTNNQKLSQLYNSYHDFFKGDSSMEVVAYFLNFERNQNFYDNPQKVYVDFIDLFNVFFDKVIQLNLLTENGRNVIEISLLGSIDNLKFNGLYLSQIFESDLLCDFIEALSGNTHDYTKGIFISTFLGKVISSEDYENFCKFKKIVGLDRFDYDVESISDESFRIKWNFTN